MRLSSLTYVIHICDSHIVLISLGDTYDNWIHNYLCNQSSNPTHGEVYSIQNYVIKFVSGQWFSLFIPVFSKNKTARHNKLKYCRKWH